METKIDTAVFQEIRETYGKMIDADLSEITPDGLFNLLLDEITDLELENHLFQRAIEHSLTAEQTERWMGLVSDEIEKMSGEGGMVSTEIFDRLLETVKVTN